MAELVSSKIYEGRAIVWRIEVEGRLLETLTIESGSMESLKNKLDNYLNQYPTIDVYNESFHVQFNNPSDIVNGRVVFPLVNVTGKYCRLINFPDEVSSPIDISLEGIQLPWSYSSGGYPNLNVSWQLYNSLNYFYVTIPGLTNSAIYTAYDNGEYFPAQAYMDDTIRYGLFINQIPTDEYRISVKSVDNGSASTSLSMAKKGDNVIVTFSPSAGYVVDWDNVTITTIGAATVIIKDTETTGHFTMPAGNVTINPAFKLAPTKYPINFDVPDNGYATADYVTAEAGTEITVTFHPDSGYEVDWTNTTITASIGVALIQVDATHAKFTMPESAVRISPAFEVLPYGWQISVNNTDNGWAETDRQNNVPEYQLINVTFHPDSGYEVDRPRCTVLAGSTRVDLIWIDATHARFNTPSIEGVGNLIVYPYFKWRENPYQPGGTSGVGGGGGNFSDTSDPVPPSTLPTVTVTNSGLVTLFRPDASQVASLGRYLWTNLTDFIENLQKMFSNPMDTFIAFQIVPCIPAVGSSRNIKLGLWETSISMPPVLSQWYEFDFGSVIVPPYSGTFLDYAPNTKISMMLPFIGNVALNVDEVMGKNLNLKYRIDLLSGACVAMITVDGDVYYQFTGECSVSIPLTGSDWSRVYSATFGAIATAITGGIAAGGSAAAGQAFVGASVVGSVSKITNAAAQAGNAFNNVPKGVHGAPAMRQALLNTVQQANDMTGEVVGYPTKASDGIKAAAVARTANNVIGNVMSGKATVQHSGTVSGSAGMLGVRAAYLMIEYPNQSVPDNYSHYMGYPLNVEGVLGDYHGFTQCEQVYATGIPGTDEEYAELVNALKEGVYL